MQCIVLAGGFGTRLQGVVKDLPKPLAPINGVPFLDLQIDKWITEGVNDFYFALHHKADAIINRLQHYQTIKYPHCRFNYTLEEIPLGTGGAARNVAIDHQLAGHILVTNADTWLTGAVTQLRNITSNTVALSSTMDGKRYGQVKVSENGQVTAFVEKSTSMHTGLTFTGVSSLIVEDLKSFQTEKFSLEREFFTKLIENKRLNSAIIDTQFIDIGIPADYLKLSNLLK